MLRIARFAYFRNCPRRLVGLRALLSVLLPIAAAGCHPGTDSAMDTGGGGGTTLITHPNQPPLAGESACTVTTRIGIEESSANHVPVCTAVTYATNPPSGGPHWPVWAAFAEYTTAVPHEMYVHDMEHGAVVLTYRCAQPCPDIVSALEGVMAAVPADPLCAGTGASARMVMTPDLALPTPIAASAWGATYTATCIDVASLSSFVAGAYGHGPEMLCAAGEDVASVIAGCPGID